MAVAIHCVGWDAPVLPCAADWLLQTLEDRLGQTVVVVPGSRAGRRLGELLAERGAGRALVPPRVVTVGQLPELLYVPPRPVASPLVSLLARLSAIDEADPELLGAICPRRTATDALAGGADSRLRSGVVAGTPRRGARSDRGSARPLP